jgi:DNA invertase Pin-like site-specific DNA recombinase
MAGLETARARGREGARARGRKGSGPTALTEEKLRAAQSMLAAGESVAAVAKVVGVSRATVYRGLRSTMRNPAA